MKAQFVFYLNMTLTETALRAGPFRGVAEKWDRFNPPPVGEKSSKASVVFSCRDKARNQSFVHDLLEIYLSAKRETGADRWKNIWTRSWKAPAHRSEGGDEVERTSSWEAATNPDTGNCHRSRYCRIGKLDLVARTLSWGWPRRLVPIYLCLWPTYLSWEPSGSEYPLALECSIHAPNVAEILCNVVSEIERKQKAKVAFFLP